MRIGVLTSGGDAPGMNATIRAVVRAAVANKDQIFGIYDGYRGLVEGKLQEFDRKTVLLLQIIILSLKTKCLQHYVMN